MNALSTLFTIFVLLKIFFSLDELPGKQFAFLVLATPPPTRLLSAFDADFLFFAFFYVDEKWGFVEAYHAEIVGIRVSNFGTLERFCTSSTK